MNLPLPSVILALLIFAAGCGSSGESRDEAEGAAVATEAAAATPPAVETTPAAKAAVDAEAVVAGLAVALPSVKMSIVYTADTDPNQKLGRPGGYTSKAAFTDSRVDAADAQDTDPGAVDLGGGVEVFGSPDAARARGETIQQAQAGTGFLAREYQFVSGGVLLRLAAGLTPDEAATFGPALAGVTGVPAESLVVE